MKPAAALLFCAICLRADSVVETYGVIRKAADALRSHNAAALWLLFDPKMPGYAALRSASGALIRSSDIDSVVDFRKNDGDDHSRVLEMDWRLDITQTERVGAVTHRRRIVTCRLEQEGEAWRIVSFEPVDFFAPTHAAEAWDEIAAAAAALTSPPDDAPVSPSLFLRDFDVKMPGYADLRAGITALARRGAIESSVELSANEGDDAGRKVEVDWTLDVTDPQSGQKLLRKEERVKFAMEWEGKRWRIASVEPIAFFAP